MLGELALPKAESRDLLGVYDLFLLWMLLETAGVTNFVPGM